MRPYSYARNYYLGNIFVLNLQCYEDRLDEMTRRHPEMPSQAVKLIRFALFAQRQLEEHLAGVLAKHGLSHSAFSLLMLTYSSPTQSITPSAASEALGQSRPHMTRMTDELVARSWVERIQDSNDRRAVEIRVTAAGDAGLRDLLPQLWIEYEHLLRCFSPEESCELGRLLRKWLVNLESDRQPGAGLIDKEER